MRGNAFEIIRQDWNSLSLEQWKDYLRINGALSQKQCRQLVEELPSRLPTEPAAVHKQLLGRVMNGFSSLSVDEKERWWEIIAQQPSAIHTAMARGLDFVGVDQRQVHAVMSFNLRHHPGVAAKVWEELLSPELRKATMDKVISAWSDSDGKLFERYWSAHLDEHVGGMTEGARVLAVSRVLSHIEDLLDASYPVSQITLEVARGLITRIARPELLLLTRFQSRLVDPAGLLPPFISQEQAYVLDQGVPQVSRSSGSMRL